MNSITDSFANFLFYIPYLLVILLHLYFLYMEMFAWETVGKKAFGKKLPADYFAHTKTLAANQGLYNGFLVAGLIWHLLIPDNELSMQIAYFFLLCVIVVGIYGGITVGKRIFIIQAIPAIIALIILVVIM